MVNTRLTPVRGNPARATSGRTAIDGRRIEYALRVDERKCRGAVLVLAYGTVEARPATGMAGRATCLIDSDPERILIAIKAHLDDPLHMAGGLALAPQRRARTTKVPRLSSVDGLA